MSDWYEIGSGITWAIVSLGTWVYCSLTYGFLGFALGWIPALIVGAICAALWPLLVLLLVGAALLIVALSK